ncbi:hypothetical protein BJV77DRAFT_456503 [Russula vinacea]|nr:hypothetical protein BJV77DRAFT_456503 [Russula vinacea]
MFSLLGLPLVLLSSFPYPLWLSKPLTRTESYPVSLQFGILVWVNDSKCSTLHVKVCDVYRSGAARKAMTTLLAVAIANTVGPSQLGLRDETGDVCDEVKIDAVHASTLAAFLIHK